jgi:uncharacterized membrane protein
LTARIRKFFSDLGDAFWLVPGLMVLGGILGAAGLVDIERNHLVPHWLIEDRWLYSGGATGARTLLGAVASSTIGVAGTVFSITIAALSLAANQMGPRLLRNFVRDRGNQITLGILLGTFAFALMVLRSVRTPSEGEFIPHLALSVGILLAFASVGTLVYFVGHMAGRINVDIVIELVTDDVRSAIRRLALDSPQRKPPAESFWRSATPIVDPRHGYVQELDGDGLADWAAEHGTAIRLFVRPGDYVFPGAPIAALTSPVKGAYEAIRNATALGSQRVSSVDIEYTVRQLVEVAVRALSAGINDPHTAINVLDRLGAALCELAPLHLPSGVWLRDGKVVLVVPSVDYQGLTDAMFHMIRQSAASKPAALIRMIEVLTAVASCERDSVRTESLKRHSALILADGERSFLGAADVEDLRGRHAAFTAVCLSRSPCQAAPQS